MPVRRVYQCAQCRFTEERLESITSPPLSVCPVTSCGAPSLRQVYAVPPTPLVRGTAGAPTRFRRPWVGREQDGRETVYTTLESAERGERERAEGAFGGGLPAWAQRRVAESNIRHMRKYAGLVEGTQAAAVCGAIEERT